MHAHNHSADQNSSGGGALLMQQAEEDVDLLSDFGHKHQPVPMQNFDPSQRFASHMGINSPTPSRGRKDVAIYLFWPRHQMSFFLSHFFMPLGFLNG